ncbi:hypothetical protein Ccrd_001674 [Cynara cardunculus var. scolymus]|uniref:Uncharacterized protein n=1 Tax=Cynara cardunculus var. scolymus TaxID=59895 RepID=A0A103XSU3_CYNCS|nr:hypothetical protein Ccrd_001674 [Cynara cardunculus var. scolymus]
MDFEEFKAGTKQMMVAMANNLSFLSVQMILDEDSFLKKVVDRAYKVANICLESLSTYLSFPKF